MLATIGYESASQEDLIATLLSQRIDVLIDIRDRAQSRRVGFSKSSLSQALLQNGVEYLHFRELGDPKEGRDAARAGKIDEFHRIYSQVLRQETARQAMDAIRELAEERRVCLMCYERDPFVCHRKIVSDHIQPSLDHKVVHLGVVENGSLRRA